MPAHKHHSRAETAKTRRRFFRYFDQGKTPSDVWRMTRDDALLGPRGGLSYPAVLHYHRQWRASHAGPAPA